MSLSGLGWGRRETSGFSPLSGGTSGKPVTSEVTSSPTTQEAAVKVHEEAGPRSPARCQELQRQLLSWLKSELCSGLSCWVWAYLGELPFSLGPPEIFQPGKMESTSPQGC